jgi:hypothetical protein
VSVTRTATLRADVSQDREKPKAGLSVTTLMIASLSSLAAALVVSRLWGGGTLIGAAMTPVIVALVSEGLNRPAKVIGTVPAKAIGTVRQTRGGRYDPVAEGRAGLREGDYERARSSAPAAAVAERRMHRASGRGGTGTTERTGGGGFSLRLPRPRVIAAIATGLVAFVVAGVFLTGSELVLGKSVTSSSKRTTFVPVKRSTSSTKDRSKDKTDTTKSDTTPTDSTSTTPTTPSTSTPATTPTVPPAQQTAPAVPPTTTAPPSVAPTPTAPATPAPQSATPPATTP